MQSYCAFIEKEWAMFWLGLFSLFVKKPHSGPTT